MIIGHIIAFIVISIGIALIAIGWRWRKTERRMGKIAGDKFEEITSLLMQFATQVMISGSAILCIGLIILLSLYD